MGVFLPTVLPTVTPTNKLASYQRTPVVPAASAGLASASTGSYVNQQIGGLRAGLPAGSGALRPGALSPENQAKLAPTAVGVELAKTVSNLKQGNANINQIVAQGQAKRARTAQAAGNLYQSGSYAPAPGGSFGPSGGKGQIATNGDGRLGAYGGGGQFLAKNAAASLTQLNNAYRAATGGNISLTEGWRSLSTQQKYYALHQAGKMPQAVATPGHSVHGTGNAADLGGIGGFGSSTFNWLVANGPKYGWSNVGRNFGESWHWEYGG